MDLSLLKRTKRQTSTYRNLSSPVSLDIHVRIYIHTHACVLNENKNKNILKSIK